MKQSPNAPITEKDPKLSATLDSALEKLVGRYENI
jgi:hypothetical protein